MEETETDGTEIRRRRAAPANEARPGANDARDAAPTQSRLARDLPERPPSNPQQSENDGGKLALTLIALNAMPHNVGRNRRPRNWSTEGANAFGRPR
jgi:hypothetical protein